MECSEEISHDTKCLQNIYDNQTGERSVELPSYFGSIEPCYNSSTFALLGVTTTSPRKIPLPQSFCHRPPERATLNEDCQHPACLNEEVSKLLRAVQVMREAQQQMQQQTWEHLHAKEKKLSNMSKASLKLMPASS
ncbi:myosin-15-like protein [Cricetulus griseus]|uniref:Myosin-15-like protein n=1 Tax=Cricetulus griseus TaxID=10029 RepID=A0A061I7H9_CRIGR|nr:myosin-15-like protein [Cricetulus griseus]